MSRYEEVRGSEQVEQIMMSRLWSLVTSIRRSHCRACGSDESRGRVCSGREDDHGRGRNPTTTMVGDEWLVRNVVCLTFLQVQKTVTVCDGDDGNERSEREMKTIISVLGQVRSTVTGSVANWPAGEKGRESRHCPDTLRGFRPGVRSAPYLPQPMVLPWRCASLNPETFRFLNLEDVDICVPSHPLHPLSFTRRELCGLLRCCHESTT